MAKNFNDGWFFKLELKNPPSAQGDAEHSIVKQGDDGWKPVEIPHDWLIYDVSRLYENGVGRYKKTFNIELQPGQRVFLRFDGVYMDSALYVNGKKAGEWKYGYTAFEYNITGLLRGSGKNELLLEVNFQSPNSRWYSGAGIYRDCWLKIKNAAHFISDGIYITPCRQPNGNWRVCVEAETETAGQPFEISHRILKDGLEVPCEKQEDGSLIVCNPCLWDINTPVCYTLHSELIIEGQVRDRAETRFGFRETAFTANGGFFLNGRRVKLFGACQHHDLGALGAAVHKDALRRQLLKLKEMGVNALRTAHNPPAAVFMELTDEMGFLVMSELCDMWSRPKTTYDYARFFNEWVERDAASWIRRDRNCPSLIMWSVGNEIYDTHADSGEGGKTLEMLMELVKKHDPKKHAPATLCSNYMPWENTQKCADIIKLIGYNYAEYLYDSHHKAHPDWIIYGGETASTVQSRGVYRFPLSKSLLSDDDFQCSALGNSTTSWGAKNTEACITDDRDADYSLGQFIWTGTDYIGEPTPYHTKNSYFGQIDTAGFEKDSFYIYQSAWTDYKKAPMVHIFPYWDFSPGQPVDVRVCSNAPEVALLLNGKPLGAQFIDHKKGKKLTADYCVPYEEGLLKALAYDENGRVVAEAVRQSFGDAEQLVINHTRIGELIFTEITAADALGRPVENANNRVRVSVSGGVLLGMDNGDSTDTDPYKTNSRRMFNGKLLAITRPDGEGRTEITAEMDKNDIPVRKIELSVDGFTVTARTFPHNAAFTDLRWRLTDSGGIDSPLGRITPLDDGKTALITPRGDGEVYIRCSVENGKGHADFISVVPLRISGYGKPFINPYGFVSGGLYNRSNLPMTNGNERGVATLRDGESHVGFADLDFGSYGSDELTLWLFPFSGEPFPIGIWTGMPGEGRHLCTVRYDKGSVWNTYLEVTYTLPEKLRGVVTLCFVFNQKVHIKGFRFTAYEKAFQQISFGDNDHIYGDSFSLAEDAVENIGNNVSIVFNDMDFTEESKEIEICWRSRQDKNTIRLSFTGESGEAINQILLPAQNEYGSTFLPLETGFRGKGIVSFIFLPGCNIDLRWFRFL